MPDFLQKSGGGGGKLLIPLMCVKSACQSVLLISLNLKATWKELILILSERVA